MRDPSGLGSQFPTTCRSAAWNPLPALEQAPRFTLCVCNFNRVAVTGRHHRRLARINVYARLEEGWHTFDRRVLREA